MRISTLSLDALKVQLIAKIDAEAEAARGAHITLGAGQALVYEAKLREADMILAPDSTVSPAEVPNLAAEADDLGISLYDAAWVIVTVAYSWSCLSAEIERIRLGAKRAITEATTPAAARAAAEPDWSPVLP
jgi:hypothetical protein